MQTVQRSWRHSLAGAFLLAVLAPANDAVPAGEPPGSPEKVAGEPKSLPQLEREAQQLQIEIIDLDVRRTALKQKAKPDSQSIKEIDAQISKLEAKKRKLEEEQKAQHTKQIRVFRLKHVKSGEVRQALESLLRTSTGAAMGGGMGGSGSMMMMSSGSGGAGVPKGMMGGAGMPGMRPAMMGAMAGHDWRLTIDERTQSIIMRGSRGDLQRAADLIALLDQPGGKAVPKVKNLQAFKLKYAKADKLTEILGQLDIDANILPLTQTNRLIVTGSDAALKEVADLIEQLDVEANGSK